MKRPGPCRRCAYIIFRYNAVADGATALRSHFAACNVRSGSKAEKLRQSKCFPLYSQHRTLTRVLSCRINIGGPLAPRMRTSCAPGGSRTVASSGRSQPSDPLASKLKQRTQPKVCGAPNTNFEVLFSIGWDFFYRHAAFKILQLLALCTVTATHGRQKRARCSGLPALPRHDATC